MDSGGCSSGVGPAGGDPKDELGPGFRAHMKSQVFDLLRKTFHNNDGPGILQQLRDIIDKFEDKIFTSAKSKQDYVTKLGQKLLNAKAYANSRRHTSSNQGKEGASQPLPHATMELMLNSNTEQLTDVKTFRHDRNGEQSALQFQQSHPQIFQTNTSNAITIKHPFENLGISQSSVVNMQPYQPSMSTDRFISNPILRNLPNQSSSPLLLAPLKSREQSVSWGDKQQSCQMPTASLSSQHGIGPSSNAASIPVAPLKPREQISVTWGDKQQSCQMPTASLSSQHGIGPSSNAASIPVPVPKASFAENQNAATCDLQSLVAKFQRVKEDYLPDLVHLLKAAHSRFSEARTAAERERYKNMKSNIERMIHFLRMPSADIPRVCSTEKLIVYLKKITHYVSLFRGKSSLSSGNQPLQILQPAGHSSIGQQQNFPSQSVSSNVRMDPRGPIPLALPSQGVAGHASNLHQPVAFNTSKQELQIRLDHGQTRSTAQNVGPSMKCEMPQIMVQKRKPQTLPQTKDEMMHSELRQVINDTPGITSNHSTSHVDLSNRSAHPLRAGEVSRHTVQDSFVNSPSVASSLSSVPKESGNCPNDLLPSPLAITSKDSQASVAVAAKELQGQNEVKDRTPMIGTPGNSGSCLHSNTSNIGDKDSSLLSQQPLERLLKAVQSASSKAFADFGDEISSVISSHDIVDEAPGEDTYEVVANKESTTRERLGEDAEISCSKDGYRSSIGMKRSFRSMGLDASPFCDDDGSSLWCSGTAALSRIKRRSAVRYLSKLYEEIRKVNNKFVETAVVVVSHEESTEEDAATDDHVRQGTTVRFTYTALSLGRHLWSHISSSPSIPILSVDLRLPANYPDSCPQILSSAPRAEHCKRMEEVIEKARSRFSRGVRCVPGPFLLEDMAYVWEATAREVLSECINDKGQAFSSKLGTWECILGRS